MSSLSPNEYVDVEVGDRRQRVSGLSRPVPLQGILLGGSGPCTFAAVRWDWGRAVHISLLVRDGPDRSTLSGRTLQTSAPALEQQGG